MELNFGVQAAKRQTWREKNVRELVLSIIEAWPAETISGLRARFSEACHNNTDYFDAVCDYAFDAAYLALKRKPNPRNVRIDQASTLAAERREHLDMVEYVKEKIILLNQEAPNGKRWRYVTREELMQFNGGYGRIIKKMKPRQIIGGADPPRLARLFDCNAPMDEMRALRQAVHGQAAQYQIL